MNVFLCSIARVTVAPSPSAWSTSLFQCFTSFCSSLSNKACAEYQLIAGACCLIGEDVAGRRCQVQGRCCQSGDEYKSTDILHFQGIFVINCNNIVNCFFYLWHYVDGKQGYHVLWENGERKTCDGMADWRRRAWSNNLGIIFSNSTFRTVIIEVPGIVRHHNMWDLVCLNSWAVLTHWFTVTKP